MADDQSFAEGAATAPTTSADPPAPATGADERGFPLSGPSRVLLATLSLAAGAIHLWMVPSHTDEWLAEIPQVEEWFAKFGDKLPAVLWSELDALKSRLNAEHTPK